MPRIDPLKLLSCLGVLLAPNGGILSSNEVQRLASLMARYSKKLVSKCIYIHILKCTETDLLGQFMAAGGWTLTHVWLQDGITTFNWPFVQELLEMLLMCPVDGNRLKTNSAPKLVKNLSQTCPNNGVRILATKLVEQWLKIARQETQESVIQRQMQIDSQSGAPSLASSNSDQSIAASTNGFSQEQQANSDPDNISANQVFSDNEKNNNDNEKLKSDLTNDIPNANLSPSKESLVFKISKKNGKQVIETVIKPEVANVSDSVDSADKTEDIDQKDPPKETAGKKKPEKKKSIERKDSSSDSGSTTSSSKDKEKSEKNGKIEKSKEKEKESDREKDKEKDKSKKSSSSHHKSSSSSKSSSSRSSSSSHKSSSSSSKSASSSSKSSSSSSRDKEREREKDRDKSKDKDRKSSSSSSSKTSSSKNRDSKDSERKRDDKKDSSQAEKDKDTLAKVFSNPMAKLGKIPKKVHSESSDSSPTKENKDKDKDKSKDISKKSTSISIEVRKGDKPKTVKTLNSQFRNHGLAEEAPPPPSRKTLKKPSASPSSGTVSSPTTLSSTSSTSNHSNSLKRSSPPPAKYVPPEKKIKDDPIPDREGGIKLIKPKPFLVESDLFMDELKSSSHKTVRKRKRLTSQTSNEGKPKTEAESPKIKSEPPQFYKDTLEESGNESKKNTEENAEKAETEGSEKVEKMEVDDEAKEKSDSTEKDEKNDGDIDIKVDENVPEIPIKRPPGIGCGIDGPPGVLMIHRRKGPKKQLKWKPQEELEEVRYFELDETERVNVTKTFIEKKQMERFDERNAFMLGRKMQTDDTMVEQTPWRPLKIVDDVPVYAYGSKSREKKIQGERESSVLQSLFFTSVPDSADEPDFENHDYSDPQVIPLDDLTGNPDAVNDFTNIPWPEPKPDIKDSAAPHMMQAFTSVFSNIQAPNMLPPAFVNPGVAALRNATPFANPAIWNMNLNMNQMNPLAAIPPMMNVNGVMNGVGVNGNPPSLLENLPFPFGGPDQLNSMNNLNAMRNSIPVNNINNRPRDRDDRRPFNRDNNWRNDRPNNGPNRNNGGNRNDWIHNNRKVCHQFQQKGYCRNGDNCNYSHSSPKF